MYGASFTELSGKPFLFVLFGVFYIIFLYSIPNTVFDPKHVKGNYPESTSDQFLTYLFWTTALIEKYR